MQLQLKLGPNIPLQAQSQFVLHHVIRRFITKRFRRRAQRRTKPLHTANIYTTLSDKQYNRQLKRYLSRALFDCFQEGLHALYKIIAQLLSLDCRSIHEEQEPISAISFIVGLLRVVVLKNKRATQS